MISTFRDRLMALALAVTASIAQPGTAIGAPRVQNGGFEEKGDPAIAAPPGWEVDGMSPSLSLDGHVRHSGRRSLRIRYQDGFNANGYSGVTQRLDLPAAGGTVRLTGYLRKDVDASKVGLWIVISDASGAKLRYLNSYEDHPSRIGKWVRHEIRVPIPATGRSVRYGAAIYDADGTMWVDDVRLALEPGGRTRRRREAE